MPPAPADLTSMGAGWPVPADRWPDLPRIIPREAFPHGPRLILAPRCWLLAGSRPPRQGSHKPIPEPPAPLPPPPPPALPGHGMADSPLPCNALGVRDSRGNRWLRAWRFSPSPQRAVSKQGMGLPLYWG